MKTDFPLTIRPAVEADIPGVAAIYEKIHSEEEVGRTTIGWQRGVYPTRATAETALSLGDLFVGESGDRIAAAMRLNQEQVDVYVSAAWEHPAPPEQVMVMHTLVVDPELGRRGIAARMIAFYERYALEAGCPFLRIDTNERNLRARGMYRKLGYKEVSILPCNFNGIPGVGLVCIEKYLGENKKDSI